MVALNQSNAQWQSPEAVAARVTMADLLQRVAVDRDEEAYKELFSMYGPRVKAMMLRQGANAELAEEIAQETLLTVWRKSHLFSRDRGSATTWIYTIARNLRIDRLRREVPWQELDESRSNEASDDPLPDDVVSSGQISVRVREALARLPEEQQEVVRLSYLKGLSHSEIADQIGVPLGTVKSRMRLAYRKMRECFEVENED